MKKPILTAAIPLLISIQFFSCASRTPRLGDNSDSHVETIVILGTNDIHGALASRNVKTKELPGVTPISYQKGGAAVFAAQLDVLKREFGNRLIWLDAGDHFQGTLESNIFEGASMVAWFNSLGLTAAAIGNHEFDFGPVGPDAGGGDILGALKARVGEAKYPYLAANVLERKTGKRLDWPNLLPSTLVTAGKIKVGIIGLSTPETPVTTRAEFVRDLTFDQLTRHTIQEAAQLRLKGAQIVVGVIHSGLHCKPGSNQAIKTARDPLNQCKSDDKAEAAQWIKSLPAGTIDAAVTGHTHSLVTHFIQNTPVIQGGAQNNFFNLIYLKYDLTAKRVITSDTSIEGPIPICPKVFENQGDCSGENPAPTNGRGDLVTPTLHDQKIKAKSETERLLSTYIDQVEEAKRRPIAAAGRAIAHEYPCSVESELGNLVADAMRIRTNADVGLANCGMIRSGLELGQITYGDLFRIIPFDNAVQVLKVTGAQLKLILQISQSGSRGYFPTSGLELKVIDPSRPAPTGDLDGDGKVAAWEVNRLAAVTLANGKPIEPTRTYRLATVDFLVGGGDDMGWIMKQIPREKIETANTGLVREVVESYFKELGTLNTAEMPAIHPTKPRIRFVSEPQGKARAKKSRRSKKKQSQTH